MEISHEENKKEGAFFVENDGGRIAELQYFQAGEDSITIYHTEVDPSLRGRGVGEQLVGRAVGYARENGLKIHATCPFAHKLIAKDPKNKDILL